MRRLSLIEKSELSDSFHCDTVIPALAAAGSVASALGTAALKDAGSIFNSVLGYKSSSQANKINKQMAMNSIALQQYSQLRQEQQNTRDYNFQREQFEYNKALNAQQMQREDTQYQRTVKDMTAAGINPILINGASTNTMTASSFSGAGTTGQMSGASANQSGYTPDIDLSGGLTALDTYNTLLDSKEARKASRDGRHANAVRNAIDSALAKLEFDKYHDNKDGNSRAQQANTWNANESARAQSLKNDVDSQVKAKLGITLSQLQNMDWPTAAAVIGMLKGDSAVKKAKSIWDSVQESSDARKAEKQAALDEIDHIPSDIARDKNVADSSSWSDPKVKKVLPDFQRWLKNQGIYWDQFQNMSSAQQDKYWKEFSK